MLGRPSLGSRAPSPNLMMPLYVQYGCGDCAPEAWVNFDASPRLRLQRLPLLKYFARLAAPRAFPANVRWGDICRGLPVADAAAAGVYCSHVLEHLPRSEVSAAVSQTRRILMPGGRFRLVVPDLQWRAQHYVAAAQRGDPLAADQFFDSCMLGIKYRERGIVALLQRCYGLSAHLWMYDFCALKTLLENAGFARVRKCELGDSEDPMFALVEDKVRFSEGGESELAIEATKPG
jgi:predicted SAM-dependent methyltransferase